jgi:hypothetical protein
LIGGAEMKSSFGFTCGTLHLWPVAKGQLTACTVG